MPTFERDGVSLYYEEHGSGFPVLLFAPGGMRSAIQFWENSPWNPIETFAPHFRVIAMDQRNAGRSTAPVTADDGWHSYTADHIALLDHLGAERCHLMGGCIGGPYCMGVIEAQPERVAAALLQQTIGADNNRDAFYEMFDSWAGPLREAHPEISEADLTSFRSNMYDGDFLYNVSREFVKACPTPLLLLLGDDLYHPQSTSREVAELAPNAQLIERWKDPDVIEQTKQAAVAFLQQHTP